MCYNYYNVIANGVSSSFSLVFPLFSPSFCDNIKLSLFYFVVVVFLFGGACALSFLFYRLVLLTRFYGVVGRLGSKIGGIKLS